MPFTASEFLDVFAAYNEALWPLAVGSSTNRFVPLAIARAYAGDAELIRKMIRTYAGGDSFGELAISHRFRRRRVGGRAVR